MTAIHTCGAKRAAPSPHPTRPCNRHTPGAQGAAWLAPCAAALALAALLPSPALAQDAQAAQGQAPRAATAAPGAAETEFWRAAERLGTADAFKAYLAAFPEGFYAPLARAALAQGGAARPAQGAGGGGLPPPSAALAHFTAPVVRSGAVTFNLGDRFTGPGVLTVGWAGAKRQVLVPPGEWVVLAMADSKVDMTPPVYRFPTRVVVDIGTLVLGRFSGTRLASAMVYHTSVRPESVDDWSDIAACQPGALESLLHEGGPPRGLRSTCAAVRPVVAPLAGKGPAMEEARASLARLGAQVHGDALATVAVVSEPRRGYLAGVRLDWPGVALGAEADAAAAWTRTAAAADKRRAATVAGLIDWLATYRKLLEEAYVFKIDQGDLKAGAGSTGAGTPLLRDVQPG